jgi:uncharacterized 2Fe-2S/4Fe-4S cluster protein (DUF4445 family)
MPNQHQLLLVNQDLKILVDEGSLVGDILREENQGVDFPCNGQGTCGKCRVKVSGPTNPHTAAEKGHLNEADLAAGIRLACQARVMGPIEVELAGAKAGSILSAGFFQLDRLDPGWERTVISKPALVSWENITKELSPGVHPTADLLQKITRLPFNDEQLAVEIFNGRVIEINPPGEMKDKFAVAVDIGTTTVAAYLVDFKSGRVVKTASGYNPQAAFGADVVSRIGAAGTPDGLEKLHRLIIDKINDLLAELARERDISSEQILQLNLVGNSCMTHLLLKVDPSSLGKKPFEPVFKCPVEVSPAELGVKLNQAGLVNILPGIGGFVGSDITAGVLACHLKSDQTELLIDIGTNGEVVLTGKGRMLACSTAAGPAFEGTNIACGMLAQPGAITDIHFAADGDAFQLTTIGNEDVRGICGTGLVRILAELLKKGMITESGRFEDGINDPNYDPDQKRYYLAQNNFNPIYLSQADIRQFQLAKGAIRTGLELLMKRLAITPADLDTVYLAGAFGTYLNPADAIFLGLLPEVPLDRIKPVGNTAGMGAIISILSQSAMERLSSLTGTIEHIELADDPGFLDVFTESMLFGQ